MTGAPTGRSPPACASQQGQVTGRWTALALPDTASKVGRAIRLRQACWCHKTGLEGDGLRFGSPAETNVPLGLTPVQGSCLSSGENG